MNDPKSNKPRAQWGSKLGFFLAAAGSAVGLGNIWKFPGKAYEGGGGLYILVYLIIVLAIGIPVMLSELSIGRAGNADTVGCFNKLDKRFKWVGWAAVIIPFIITSYYSHVGGWVMRYVFSYITEPAKVFADPTGYFYGLLGYDAAAGTTFTPWPALIFAAVFLTINAVVIILGVEKGIERFSKIGMPILFVLLLVLLVRSLTLPGAGEGLKYMFSLDFSKFDFVNTILSALGQAFYSLSLGMGIMITYGSYVNKKEDLAGSSIQISLTDTLVAFLAGFIIVPACFATLGADSIGKGGSFAFVSLAGVFNSLPAGQLFGIVFYVLLLFAALTSLISLTETLTSFMTEHFHWKRTPAVIGLSVVLFLIGCLYTLSQASMNIKGIWFDCANGFTFPCFGDFMEFVTDRLMIPVCAFGICLFVGWFWKPKNVIEEVRSSGAAFKWAGLYSILIKYIAPISILLILVWSFVKGTTLS